MLIIIVPTVLVQIVATYIFYQRHWNSVSSHMMSALSGDIALVDYLSQHQTHKVRERLYVLTNDYLSLKATFLPGKKLLPSPDNLPEELIDLRDELSKRISSKITITYTTSNKQDVLIAIQLTDGVLNIVASRKRFDNPTTTIFILWMTGTAALLLIIAILFSRIQIRSISRLAIAAEKFGKGQENSGFKPEGAHEVRKAAMAFLKMKERIERQITQRTEMLAGVSHDLRTPLTRMKLQLAILGDTKDMEDFHHDIVDMEKMIQGYLDFARGDGEEPAIEVNVTDFLTKIPASYQNAPITMDNSIDPQLVMHLRPQAFKRAITNIVSNALRYGKHITLRAEKIGIYLSLTIDDDGPGIPEDQREMVFKPFYRIDSSRNLDSGGVGLGLAIARDIINGHGGTITLGDSPEGGLRVVIRVPL